MMLNKSLCVIVFCLLLTACNGVTFRTNAGAVALNNAVAGTVEVYSQAEMSRHKFMSLGEVSTTFCSTQIYPAEHVNLDDLKKDLKVQVKKLGGNAIIFYTCGKASYPACELYFECYGEGFSIED